MNTSRVIAGRTLIPRGPRGSIGRLPSGSLRVRVYAGVNPVTGRPRYLAQTVPAGPAARVEADAVCRRLLDWVRERRAPRTDVTVSELVARHLALLHAAETTRRSHRSMVGKHIDPLVGRLRLTAVTPEILDSFYAELLRCRDHWPSFYAAQTSDAVILQEDRSLGMVRTEVICATCHSHLGHVFEGEGYDNPTDQRYCINSISLRLMPTDKEQ